MQFYVNYKSILRTVYFAIFYSYIIYDPIASGNTNYTTHRIFLLQKKALRVIHVGHFNSHTSPLFSNSNILKFIDIIHTEHFVFINNCLKKDFFAIFDNIYNLYKI